MFENLTEKLQRTFKNLRGQGKLTDEHLDSALAEIRDALLEGDVNVGVADELLANIRRKAIGSEVLLQLSPDQQVVKVVRDELAAILGKHAKPIFASRPPSVWMIVGLQGSGKTTIIQTEGGREAKIGLACLPRMAASSSRTTLTTCWSGESCSMTSLPMALARMLARSSSATPTLTSPSSSASRISASAVSRCSSVSLPCPRRFLKVRCSFSVRFSNMVWDYGLVIGDW